MFCMILRKDSGNGDRKFRGGWHLEISSNIQRCFVTCRQSVVLRHAFDSTSGGKISAVSIAVDSSLIFAAVGYCVRIDLDNTSLRYSIGLMRSLQNDPHTNSGQVWPDFTVYIVTKCGKLQSLVKNVFRLTKGPNAWHLNALSTIKEPVSVCTVPGWLHGVHAKYPNNLEKTVSHLTMPYAVSPPWSKYRLQQTS